jgi:opacity protein-like surface antigen
MRLVESLLTAAILAVFLAFPSISLAADETGAGASGNSALEERLVSNDYSVGLTVDRGWSLNHGARGLDFYEAMPSVTFPISGVMGRSFYRGMFEYKVEGLVGVVTNRSDRGIAGLSPVGLRYNFTPVGAKVSPYIEGLLGGVYLNVHRDVQGTRFNFIESIGAGVNCFATEKLAFNIGFRYRHLSNADIREPNKGANTAFLVLGLSYF